MINSTTFQVTIFGIFAEIQTHRASKIFSLFVVNVLMHRFHKCEVHCSFIDLKSIFEHLSEGKVHILWRLDITKSSFYLPSALKDKH